MDVSRPDLNLLLALEALLAERNVTRAAARLNQASRTSCRRVSASSSAAAGEKSPRPISTMASESETAASSGASRCARSSHRRASRGSPAATLLMNRGLRDLSNDADDAALTDFNAVLTLEPNLADAYHRRELARFGIRCVSIAPGVFMTPMVAGMTAEVQESLGKQVPFPSRLGKPEEYAQLVQSVIEVVMLNGETIRLDGALRMSPR